MSNYFYWEDGREQICIRMAFQKIKLLSVSGGGRSSDVKKTKILSKLSTINHKEKTSQVYIKYSFIKYTWNWALGN